MNDPPGSKPILVESGQRVVGEEVEVVMFDLKVDTSLGEYDEATFITEFSTLYGVSASLISVEVTPISNRRELEPNSTEATSRGAQGLFLMVTILVPQDFVDERAGVLDTESSLTVANGASTSPEVGMSTAERLANRLATVNNVGGSGLSNALGFNVTFPQGHSVLVKMVERQISVSCAPGYWCSAALSIPCVHNTYQPKIDQISAGACLQCPKFSVSKEASTSIEQCKCMASYYDNETSSHKVSCKPCTVGTDGCEHFGTTTATLNISAGWYRTSSLSVDLRRCPDGSNKDSGCVGGIGDEGPCKPCAASLFPHAALLPSCSLFASSLCVTLRTVCGAQVAQRTVLSDLQCHRWLALL